MDDTHTILFQTCVQFENGEFFFGFCKYEKVSDIKNMAAAVLV